jgi:hypothetical protein
VLTEWVSHMQSPGANHQQDSPVGSWTERNSRKFRYMQSSGGPHDDGPEVANSCLEELSVCPCKESSKIWLYSNFSQDFLTPSHFTPWKHILLHNDHMHHNVAEEKMFKTELLFSLNCYVQNWIKDTLNHFKLRLMWRSNSKQMVNNVLK